MKKLTLREVINKLKACYVSTRPRLEDPFELIVWENMGYLVDDAKRGAAFNALKKEVGLEPTDLLSTSNSVLTQFTSMAGIHPELRTQRLKESAQIVLSEFDGDLSQALKLPFKKAMNALKKFPSIGEPGAEKILLFTGSAPV